MSVSFGIWTSESILRASCLEVTSSKCMVHDQPVKGGLRDPRFGVLGKGRCQTCGRGRVSCPGHWGHIVLSQPMYHISWVNHTLHWLRSLCEGCGVLRGEGTLRNRASRSHRMCSCGAKRAKYSWDKSRACITRDDEVYPASKALERFKAYVSSEYNPVDLILTVFPVPPLHVRPPLMSGGRTRGEDDLTYRFQNIIRKNEVLTKCITSKKPVLVIDQAREGLQNALTGYINHNKLTNRRHRNKREYTSLTGRLSSKEGRVRGNLMGKRANATARCVITPDDELALGEIGVPASVAKVLTKNIKVTAYNKRELEFQVHSGEVRYVVRGDGSRIDTSIRKPSLEIGWEVERSMVTGDIVLFNRQPSLHKMSMMAHTVRILPYDTFRMNTSCTTPYNADFDGDEMNVHFPQTLMAESEAREIMSVKYQIVSPQSNKPVMGLIQDSLLGMYLLSGASVSRADGMQMLQGPLPDQPTFTGLEIVSRVLPDINYRGGVRIEHGQVLSGRFTKRDLGTSHGSLIHVMFNDLGPTVCVDTMHKLQKLSHAYLQIRGFTIGLGDMVRSSEVTRLCEAERASAYADVVGADEVQTNIRLNNCRNVMGKAALSQMDESNNLFVMVHCGSKGSMVNITQLQACIGQQNVRGGRIPKEWSNRTMTQFQPGDKHPRTRGFVERSYLEGLTSSEMYFHSQAGREGLIDTAIKTAETGYIERRLSKALENIRTCADGSCRDGDRLICFAYGDDGMDGMRVEKQRFQGFSGRDEAFIRSMSQDPSVSGTDWYHLPVPLQRILETIPHGDTQMESFELDMFVSQFPPLLGAWIRAHTPTMTYANFSLYRDTIMREYQRAKICAGESVGALAAQSIGERTTQCTLNSVDYNEHLIIFNVSGCIGEVIDGIIDRAGKSGKVIHVRTRRLKALTFDKLGNVSWNRITAVTRHPPENEDGSNDLVKITTKSGRTLTCTRAKSFMVMRYNRWEPIRGCELKVGDAVPVMGKIPARWEGDPLEAFTYGVFLATGTLTPYPTMVYDERTLPFLKSCKCPLTFEDDRVTVQSERLRYAWACPPRIIGAASEYVRMFVLGYVLHRSIFENGVMFVTADPFLRDLMGLLLSSLHIPCQFYSRGFTIPDICMLGIGEGRMDVRWLGDTWVDEIVKIESVPSSHPYVYDLTVEGTKNMVVLNGIGCRDTFHFAGDSSKNVTLGVPRMEEIMNLSKKVKTPLRTYKGPVLPRLVRLSDVLVRRGPVLPGDAALLAPFWEFPDPGKYEGKVERWELYPWHDVEALRRCVGVDIAYTQGPRVVCHVYGFEGDMDLVLQGQPGGEWCRSVGDHVETSYSVYQLWEMLEDCTSVYTNDILEMHRVYGIEAARACILKEIRKILAFYGIYVNVRHLLLLADWMTHRGLTPLTRHGMKRLEETPLKRSTFEEVVDVFHQAALHNQTDKVEGISACILTGKEAKMGSNLVTVFKDEVVERMYSQPFPSEDIEMFQWIPKSCI